MQMILENYLNLSNKMKLENQKYKKIVLMVRIIIKLKKIIVFEFHLILTLDSKTSKKI